MNPWDLRKCGVRSHPPLTDVDRAQMGLKVDACFDLFPGAVYFSNGDRLAQNDLKDFPTPDGVKRLYIPEVKWPNEKLGEGQGRLIGEPETYQVWMPVILNKPGYRKQIARGAAWLFPGWEPKCE